MRRVLLALVLVLLPACGAQAAGVVSGPPIEGADEVEVRATEFAYDPTEIVVPAGQPVNVTLVNDGRSQHDIVSRDLGLRVHAAPATSSTSGFVPEEPGRYELICSVPGHARQGMEMVLVVEG